MAKIIPFAVAVILVLAVGYYLFTSKISKTPASLMQTTGVTQNPVSTGTTESEGKTGATATATPQAKNNQITLTVSTPANNTTVTTPSLTVKGTTLPGAEVSVNDKDVVAGGSGSFSATISLEEGDNYVVVVAVDADGRVAEAELNVTYTPAQ